MIKVDARIEGLDKTSAEFKEARREIYRRTRSGMKRAGEETILPRARRGTSTKTPVVSTQVIVKTAPAYAYLTCATKKTGRIVGLLNFGGTLPPVQPSKKRRASAEAGADTGRYAPAIAFGNVVVAHTKARRKYRGEHFLEHARDEGLDDFGRVLLPYLMASFDPLEHHP